MITLFKKLHLLTLNTHTHIINLYTGWRKMQTPRMCCVTNNMISESQKSVFFLKEATICKKSIQNKFVR